MILYLAVIGDHPLKGVRDVFKLARVRAVGHSQGDDLHARRNAQIVGVVGTDQSRDGRAVL